MFSREEARAARPSKELKMMFEVLMTLPYFTVHVPAKNLLVTPKGTVQIPENYREYPVLAIFYLKYLMKKHPYETLPFELTWPEPYVVVNTITKRLREHKMFANQNTDVYVERLQKAIGSGIVIPENKKDEILGQPKKRKNITREITETFTDQSTTKRKLRQFFKKLQSGKLGEDLDQGLCKVKVLISCKALLGEHSHDFNSMAGDARKVWVREMVRSMVSNENSINEDNDHEKDRRTTSTSGVLESITAQAENKDFKPSALSFCKFENGAIETEESFWNAVSELENNPITTQTQLEECARLAAFLTDHRELLQTFTRQKDNTRALFYLNLKGCLGTTWDFRIYRGIRWKKNGQLKVSFKIKNCPHISSYWVNVELTSKYESHRNIVDDVLLELTCDVQERETEWEAISEREVGSDREAGSDSDFDE